MKRKVRRFFLLKRERCPRRRHLFLVSPHVDKAIAERVIAAAQRERRRRAASYRNLHVYLLFLQKSSGIITSAAVYTRHSTSSRQSSTLDGGTLIGGKLDGDTLDGISAVSARHALLRHDLQPAARSTAACASLASCSA